jgi:hypothetical protein
MCSSAPSAAPDDGEKLDGTAQDISRMVPRECAAVPFRHRLNDDARLARFVDVITPPRTGMRNRGAAAVAGPHELVESPCNPANKTGRQTVTYSCGNLDDGRVRRPGDSRPKKLRHAGLPSWKAMLTASRARCTLMPRRHNHSTSGKSGSDGAANFACGEAASFVGGEWTTAQHPLLSPAHVCTVTRGLLFGV